MARPKKETRMVRLSDRSHAIATRLAETMHQTIGDVIDTAIRLLVALDADQPVVEANDEGATLRDAIDAHAAAASPPAPTGSEER